MNTPLTQLTVLWIKKEHVPYIYSLQTCSISQCNPVAPLYPKQVLQNHEFTYEFKVTALQCLFLHYQFMLELAQEPLEELTTGMPLG